MQKWIWEHEKYPSFPYSAEVLIGEIDRTSQTIGRLSSLIEMLDSAKEHTIKIEAFIEEIVANNEIEGEYLNRDSVRSSVRKRLDAAFDTGMDRSTHQTDALTSLLLDSSLNHEPLTLERLHRWHRTLFTGVQLLSLKDVTPGLFRDYDDMEVVSGVYGKEKVHYRAIPHERIEEEIVQLLDYINHSEENFYVKSAKAHFWFMTIHPYDDGNGRMARVIADYVLSREIGLDFQYLSVSSAINRDKKSYYTMLETMQNLRSNNTYDFTKWILWHTQMLRASVEEGLNKVNIVIHKAKFWQKVDIQQLNSRQIKVLNKLLEYGKDGFEGGLSTRKYMHMTKVSKPTAVRDIQAMVALGCLKQTEGTAGRSVKYELVW